MIRRLNSPLRPEPHATAILAIGSSREPGPPCARLPENGPNDTAQARQLPSNGPNSASRKHPASVDPTAQRAHAPASCCLTTTSATKKNA
jgi:hypothetical protein